MKGLGVDSVKATTTLISQLDFVTTMSKAGIKSDFPPTEAQLKSFFSTFAKPPNPEDAKNAFSQYVGAFQVHIAAESGDATKDVVYSGNKSVFHFRGQFYDSEAEAKKAAQEFGKNNNVSDPKELTYDGPLTSHPPKNWDDVTSKRKHDPTGEHAGKNVNDCEGFAFLAETLLGVAGFKTEGYISGLKGTGDQAHVMIVLKDPSGKPVVASNDRPFDEGNVGNLTKDPKDNLRRLLDAGWQFGSGVNLRPDDYYIGKTETEAQAAMTVKQKGARFP